jgi:hypothetical protein
MCATQKQPAACCDLLNMLSSTRILQDFNILQIESETEGAVGGRYLDVSLLQSQDIERNTRDTIHCDIFLPATCSRAKEDKNVWSIHVQTRALRRVGSPEVPWHGCSTSVIIKQYYQETLEASHRISRSGGPEMPLISLVSSSD